MVLSCFEHFFTSDIPHSSGTFPAPDIWSSVSARSLGCFWKWDLAVKDACYCWGTINSRAFPVLHIGLVLMRINSRFSWQYLQQQRWWLCSLEHKLYSENLRCTQFLHEDVEGKDGPQMYSEHILHDSLTKCSNLLSLFKYRVYFVRWKQWGCFWIVDILLNFKMPDIQPPELLYCRVLSSDDCLLRAISFQVL